MGGEEVIQVTSATFRVDQEQTNSQDNVQQNGDSSQAAAPPLSVDSPQWKTSLATNDSGARKVPQSRSPAVPSFALGSGNQASAIFDPHFSMASVGRESSGVMGEDPSPFLMASSESFDLQRSSSEVVGGMRNTMSFRGAAVRHRRRKSVHRIPVDPELIGQRVVELPTFTRIMRKESDFKQCVARLMVNVFFICLFAAIMMLQKSVWEEFHAEQPVKSIFFDVPFNPPLDNKKLLDIETFDDLQMWTRNVWAPGIWENTSIANGYVGFRGWNQVISNPLIDMRKLSVQPCSHAPGTPRRCAGSEPLDTNWMTTPFKSYYPNSDGWFAAIFCLPGNECNTHGVDVLQRDLYYARAEVTFVPNTTAPVVTPRLVTNQYRAYSLADAQAVVDQLFNDGWVGFDTAFLRFFVRVYNPNYDMYTAIKLVFVITPAGQVQPFVDAQMLYGLHHLGSVVQSRRFYLYTKGRDYVRVVLEVLFILTYLEQLRQFAVECRHQAREKNSWASALLNPWQLVDIVLFSMVFVSIVLYVVALTEGERRDVEAGKYVSLSMDTISPIYALLFSINTLCLMAFNIRLFKSFNADARFSFLTETLARSSRALVKFCIIFFLMMLGYAVSGYYFFGHAIQQFNTFPGAWSAAFQLLVGQLDFEIITENGVDNSGNFIPPVWYWTFLFVMMFLLFNMFLAIVMAAYDQTLYDAIELEILEKKAPQSRKTGLQRIRQTAWFAIRALVPMWDPKKHIQEGVLLRSLSDSGLIEEIYDFRVGHVRVQTTELGHVMIELRITKEWWDSFVERCFTSRPEQFDSASVDDVPHKNTFKIYLRLPADVDVKNVDATTAGVIWSGPDGKGSSHGAAQLSALRYATGGAQFLMDFGESNCTIDRFRTIVSDEDDCVWDTRQINIMLRRCVEPGHEGVLYQYRLNVTNAGNLAISTENDSHTFGHYERMSTCFNTSINRKMVARASQFKSYLRRSQRHRMSDAKLERLSDEIFDEFGKEVEAEEDESTLQLPTEVIKNRVTSVMHDATKELYFNETNVDASRRIIGAFRQQLDLYDQTMAEREKEREVMEQRMAGSRQEQAKLNEDDREVEQASPVVMMVEVPE